MKESFFEGISAVYFEEETKKLSGIARLLDNFLPYEYIGACEDVKQLCKNHQKDNAITLLTKMLLPISNQVALSFPGVGVAYYSIITDCIVAYAPEADFKNLIGISVPPNHIGRKAMSRKKEVVAIGSMIRGDVIAYVQPLIRNNDVLGFVGITESVADICSSIKKCGKYFNLILDNENCDLAIQENIKEAINIRLSKGIDEDIENYKIGERGHEAGEKLIVKNKKMVSLYNMASEVAVTDANVFISGESGTGKELLARHVHDNSFRKEKNIISINCGALPENLLEAELFGYEAGAFTDAKNANRVKLN